MNVVADMLLRSPAPAAIWAVLMLLGLPATIALGSPEAMRDPMSFLRESAASLRRARTQRRRAAEETIRYAEDVHVAAGRSAMAARQWDARWEQAITETNGSWRAWHDAQSRLTQVRAAAAWGTPRTAHTPAEYAERERFLHRAVMAATRRGELPASAPSEALSGRGSWDATLHPADQELVIHRATVAHLRERYRLAAAAEKIAWHDAHLARRTRDDLRREATEATVRAAAARDLLPARQDRATASGGFTLAATGTQG